MRKSNAATADVQSAPEPVDAPLELVDAQNLRAAVEKFNQGAATRTSLSTDDHAQLDRIGELRDAFIRAARKGWSRSDSSADHTPQDVSFIAHLIDVYRTTTTDDVKLELAGGNHINTPAIEAGAVRSLIARKGDEIIAALDSAVAAAYTRLAKEREAESRFTKSLRFWLNVAPVRALVIAFITILDDPILSKDEAFITRGILDDIRSIGGRLHIELGRKSGSTPPEPLRTALGFWRSWVDQARQELNLTPPTERKAS